MKQRFFVSMLALFLVVPGVGQEKPPVVDDSLGKVIMTDNYDLAEKLGDSSEGGQDDAARLQAQARRVRTESRIAAKSVRRVIILAAWRQALNRWDDVELEIVHLASGGGTMWIHMMGRNDAQVEEFLEGIADHLPLEQVEPPPAIAARIDNLLKDAKARLAKARNASEKLGMNNRQQAAGIQQRLVEAHRQLEEAFLCSGDAGTTEKLLRQCTDSSSAWKTMEDLDAE